VENKDMVVHIALFKWRDDVLEEEIDYIMGEIQSLKEKITGIIELYCGKNLSKWSKGYTHAVIVKVKDKEALDAYRNHPAHIPIAKKVEELEEDSIGIDIEV
jgi:hypothetical protein